jgi:hypothetical protein
VWIRNALGEEDKFADSQSPAYILTLSGEICSIFKNVSVFSTCDLAQLKSVSGQD